MNTPTQPTLFLGMINDAGIAKIVAQCLAYHGFTVIDHSLDTLTFRYPNLLARLRVQAQKLLGNPHAKRDYIIAQKQQQIAAQLAQHPHYDHALFIRSDIYPEHFLRQVKQKSHQMVNYQWDGMSRFAAAQSQIALFDRFYAFDPNDIAHNPKLLPATSFYFDHLPPAPTTHPSIYFLGAHRRDRIAPIVQFCQHAEQAGWALNFQIARDGAQNIEQHYPVSNIQFHNGISYQQNLDYARSSRILADFVISTHKGLSLRTFEAIGYRKKLITTNVEVQKYDFYHPSNIFIWDGKTLDGLDQFIATPYQEIDPAIREKYSFGNWIRYVLNLHPHQPISLPMP